MVCLLMELQVVWRGGLGGEEEEEVNEIQLIISYQSLNLTYRWIVWNVGDITYFVHFQNIFSYTSGLMCTKHEVLVF